MTLKRVVLAVMCVLLVTVVVLMGIAIGKVSALLGDLLGPGNHQPGTTAGQTTVPTTPSDSIPTVPPTTLPTVPPTTEPTEPEHVHEYEWVETAEPTCEVMGYSIYVCTGCGKQEIKDIVDAHGHSYGATQMIDPTCTEGGCKRRVCGNCGDVSETEKTDPLGHDLVLVEAVTGDCETAGYEKYQCSRCGYEELQNQTEPGTHQFEVMTQIREATCTEEGLAVLKCSVCGEGKLDVIPAVGHQFGEWTVGEDGLLARRCSVCDHIQTSAELKVTTVDSVKNEDGSSVYLVHVGVDEDTQMFTYVVYDYRADGIVNFTLDPVRGLVVTYTDGNGETVELVKVFLDPTPIEILAG